MRYTAKARMLSFDFLCDPFVYGLPVEQVALFAGMLARADNLGRLPGEPSVLLQYLFTPKPPREDLAERDVVGLLTELAKRGKATWYVVNGVRYVQLASWSKHQSGIRPQNRRSSFPSPDDGRPALEPTSTQMAIELRAEEPAASAAGGDVRELVRQLASGAAMHRVTGGVFEPELVVAWAREIPDASGERYVLTGAEWVKFGRWLFNTGTTRMQDVMNVLAECWRLKPTNPWAYFHQAKGTRNTVALVMNARSAEAEHEALKAEERAQFAKDMRRGDQS